MKNIDEYETISTIQGYPYADNRCAANYDGFISLPGRLNIGRVLAFYLAHLPTVPVRIYLTPKQREQFGDRFTWRGHVIETVEYDDSVTVEALEG